MRPACDPAGKRKPGRSRYSLVCHFDTFIFPAVTKKTAAVFEKCAMLLALWLF
jgi:hypothetical protein